MITNVIAAPFGYSVDNNTNLIRIDIATGATTVIGPHGIGGSPDLEAIAFDPTTGILYTASDNGSLYTFDINTGAATLIGALGVSTGFNSGMAFDSSGQGYLITTSGLFTFDKATGAATLISTFTPSIALSGGAFIGPTLYGSPDNGSSPSLNIINTATAVLTPVGALGAPSSDQTGLSYDNASSTLYMLNESDSSIYSLNTVTGVATLVSTHAPGISIEGLAINPIAVVAAAAKNIPTLSVWGLLFLTLLMGLFGANRQRKKPLKC